MSKRGKQNQANRLVRDQLARERRRQRTMWTTIIAVAVLVVAGLVGWGVYRSQHSDTFAVPAGATNDGGEHGGLVAAGTGSVTVEVYLDFICPACKQFETVATPTLNQMVADHKIRLVWHPLGFLDRNSTTKYSTRAAAAAACASDAGKLKPYGEALYANQPAEGSAGLSDDQLIDIGGPVGLNAPSFAACVRDGSYKGWVGHVDDLAAQRGVNQTPTVLVNGSPVVNPTPQELQAAVSSAS